MGLDQGQAEFGWRTVNCGFHRVEELVRAGERPRGRGMLGDPRRIFEDARQRGDEVIFAAGVEIGDRRSRHFALTVRYRTRWRQDGKDWRASAARSEDASAPTRAHDS